jgi:hypothetical protein
MTLQIVYDCTGANLGKFPIPPGVMLAGYSTGSGNVPWTSTDFAEHPGSIQIDQSPTLSVRDETADVIDIENGAATASNLPTWAKNANANFNAGTRPGQRRPITYQSANSVSGVVNALIAGGVTSGVGLWVADWDLTNAQAVADVMNASGPFPIVGVQFRNSGLYDISVFSPSWISEVSKVIEPTPTPVTTPNPAPEPSPTISIPVPGIQTDWRYCEKCTSLFYAPNISTSHCAGGGEHVASPDSYNYAIVFFG